MKYYLLVFIFALFLSFDYTDKVDNNYVFVDRNILDNEFEFISNIVKDEEETVSVFVSDDVLETQVGKLSRYGPDCVGCSGYLAYGDYVGDGRIYYYDNEYGNVRILAGDRKYPFGTIVRVNIRDDSFLAIVLDRGGAIGFGKIALFDLLYPSEYLANMDGVSYNTEFEVLRYGF